MERLPQGYTNLTRRTSAGTVEKRYEGPHRVENARRELACLTHLGARLPVPRVIESDPTIPRLVMGIVEGRHGQELIDEGHARAALRLLGESLAALQRVDADVVPELEGNGTVLVHGDFGPQNALFTPDVTRVTAILDWEFAHVGQPVEDLAWAEWIMRMHHPAAMEALDELFDGYGARPSWNERHEAMLGRCDELASTGAPLWRDRTRQTEGWTA